MEPLGGTELGVDINGVYLLIGCFVGVGEGVATLEGGGTAAAVEWFVYKVDFAFIFSLCGMMVRGGVGIDGGLGVGGL